MKVKDLIHALTQCDPEAEVCVEVNMDHSAHIVKQYNYDNINKAIYIADNVECVDDYLAGCFEECEVKWEEKW